MTKFPSRLGRLLGRGLLLLGVVALTACGSRWGNREYQAQINAEAMVRAYQIDTGDRLSPTEEQRLTDRAREVQLDFITQMEVAE